MPKTASRLGKGLNSLISPRNASLRAGPAADSPQSDAETAGIRHISLNAISPNPQQPRANFDTAALQELAKSIRAKGLIQPILVRRRGEEQYELVAGERRWRAAKLAELETIPANIRDLSDAESLELALIENLQREDLTPIERATAYQHFLDTFGGTIDDLAGRLAEGRATVSNHLRLLKLADEIRQMITDGRLGMGQARAIAGIDEPERQLALARLAVRRNLSVRQVEDLARGDGEPSTAPRDTIAPDAQRRHFADIERRLSQAAGLKVRLYPGRKKNSGRVVISFGDLDEFDRIAEALGGNVHLE